MRLRFRFRGAPGGPPAFDELVRVHEREEQRRAHRDPAPLEDPPVEAGGDVTDLLLAAQTLDRLGQPFDLLAQLQRGGQQRLGRHALPAQVIPQPGLGGVFLAPPGKRFTRAGEVVEGAPFRRLVDLLVDPRGEAHLGRFARRWLGPWRLVLCHPFLRYFRFPGRARRVRPRRSGRWESRAAGTAAGGIRSQVAAARRAGRGAHERVHGGPEEPAR